MRVFGECREVVLDAAPAADAPWAGAVQATWSRWLTAGNPEGAGVGACEAMRAGSRPGKGTDMEFTRRPAESPSVEPDAGESPAVSPFLLRSSEVFDRPVCRLGLASRGQSALSPEEIHDALERGVNFLNWPGEADTPGGPDAFSEAIANLGPRRASVVICVQFGARTAAEAAHELRSILGTLRTDFIDLITFYYVERPEEWRSLIGPGGALAYCRAAQRDDLVRRLGVTSHRRPLAAEMAESGQLDALMIRYNAAHRGAEREIFPATEARRMPVIAYTALRWGALLKPTPDDPPGFRVPGAPTWYRFVLQSPAVAVVLAAPRSRAELEADLEVLRVSGPLEPSEYARLAEHGERVRRFAGSFP